MFERLESPQGLITYQSSVLRSTGVVHVFSTRIGGTSVGPFETMNLGNPSGYDCRDSEENLAENYRRLHAAGGMEGRHRLWVFQVHGADVVKADSTELGSACKADAIVTADPTCVAAVRFADCAPVLMASQDGRTVAAVHVGWRGCAAGIIGRTLAHFTAPRDVRVAVGPCIGPEAFEVGEEVVEKLNATLDTPIAPAKNAQGRLRVDLARVIEHQLVDAGVSINSIDISRLCTYSLPDEFFSHRRDGGLTGRMAALIGPKP